MLFMGVGRTDPSPDFRYAALARNLVSYSIKLAQKIQRSVTCSCRSHIYDDNAHFTVAMLGSGPPGKHISIERANAVQAGVAACIVRDLIQSAWRPCYCADIYPRAAG